MQPRINDSNIPNRWRTVHDPFNENEITCRVFYQANGYYDPVASVQIAPPRTHENPSDEFVVEVRDINAGKTPQGQLNPTAEYSEHDTAEEAITEFYKMVEEYPLDETRDTQHTQEADREELITLLKKHATLEKSRLSGFNSQEISETPESLLEKTINVLIAEGYDANTFLTPEEQEKHEINPSKNS
jgi:hypothetical protein